MTNKSIKLKNKHLVREAWEDEWKQKMYVQKRSIISSLPSPDFQTPLIYQNHTPTAVRWIFWCRINYLPLNYFLAKRNRQHDPACSHCPHIDETLDHFLFNCPKYERPRIIILHEYFTQQRSLVFNDLDLLLSTDEGRIAPVLFFGATKRLS